MSKRYSIFITVLFCAFLGVFVLANLLTSDRVFSPFENRNLAQKPTLKASSFALDGDFFTGKFMSKYETYLTDQFVGRDGWISAKSMSERALGKQENNGVYLGKKDTLIPRFDSADPEKVATNLNYVNKLVENVDIPVYFSLIPGKVSVWADRLPQNAPNADEQALVQNAAETTSAQWLDVNSALLAHKSEEIYYRTDHHWSSLGAYYGYAALIEGMGMTPVALADYEKTTVSTEFYGTTFSNAGTRWIGPDSMDIYVPEDGVSVTSWFGPEPKEGSLYDRGKLQEKDKYAMFMGGNQSLAVITTAHPDAPKLLIVRDSYTDSMVPFLTAHFSEIHLVDPRYNKTPLGDYLAENAIDQVLVLYSVANFVSDSNLFVLSK